MEVGFFAFGSSTGTSISTTFVMADQRGDFHMSHDASLRMWPPQFKMDAIKETAWQAAKFENQKLLYLYCIDFSYLFDLTIPSLPFLKLNCVFGHVSFPSSLSER